MHQASWKSPIGDAPALTAEQESQNTADTHLGIIVWNEDNTTWDLTDELNSTEIFVLIFN